MFTREQLEKLKEAYASGVLSVRFGDQEVTYKSEEEMRKIIEKMEREISGTRSKFISLQHTKGL